MAAEARGEYISDELRAPLAILEKLEERDRQRELFKDQDTNEDDD